MYKFQHFSWKEKYPAVLINGLVDNGLAGWSGLQKEETVSHLLVLTPVSKFIYPVAGAFMYQY